MSETRHLRTPLDAAIVTTLEAGEEIALSGIIYTGRDAAHKRMCAALQQGEQPPVDLAGQVLYFTGPTPAAPGKVIGSAGPTTSSRMDAYSPLLIEKTGLRGMIGKGDRNESVVAAMVHYGCLYFAATGGAGALLARSITRAEVVAYAELGPEAIFRLEVVDMPLILAIDARGCSLYAPKQPPVLDQ